MLVVIFDSGSASWSRPFADAVSIIETHQSVSVFIMKCERVTQPMRPLSGLRVLLYNELNPAFSSCVGDETLSIEKQ